MYVIDEVVFLYFALHAAETKYQQKCIGKVCGCELQDKITTR
jgi:hypothetical protein